MTTVPGKTLSPFLAFANEQRPKLKESNPSLSFAEVQQQLSALWGQLSEEQKQGYKNRTVQPKATPEIKSTPEKNSYEGFKNIFPKLAPSPMTHYLATERANVEREFPLLSRFQLNEKLVAQWNKLTKEQKEQYEAHSATDMARYTKEWNEFLNKNPDFDMDEDSDGGEYSPSDDEEDEEDYLEEEEEEEEEDQELDDASDDSGDQDMDS